MSSQENSWILDKGVCFRGLDMATFSGDGQYLHPTPERPSHKVLGKKSYSQVLAFLSSIQVPICSQMTPNWTSSPLILITLFCIIRCSFWLGPSILSTCACLPYPKTNKKRNIPSFCFWTPASLSLAGKHLEK